MHSSVEIESDIHSIFYTLRVEYFVCIFIQNLIDSFAEFGEQSIIFRACFALFWFHFH